LIKGERIGKETIIKSILGRGTGGRAGGLALVLGGKRDPRKRIKKKGDIWGEEKWGDP